MSKVVEMIKLGKKKKKKKDFLLRSRNTGYHGPGFTIFTIMSDHTTLNIQEGAVL